MHQRAPNDGLAASSALAPPLPGFENEPPLEGKFARSPGRPAPLVTTQVPVAKRTFDFVGALSLLVVTAPLMAVIAPLVWLDSRGPVFYTQERVGLNRRRGRRRLDQVPVRQEFRGLERRAQPAEGRPFQIVKFRTMIQGAEEATGPTWATPDDPRVTRVGRVLRSTRLDELPQLWNVLCGQMSLVGPRPERPHFVNQFARRIPGYRDRLGTLPGITGLAQVEHSYDGSEADVRRKLTYDLEYLRRTSIKDDLWILVRTLYVMVTRRGAH